MEDKNLEYNSNSEQLSKTRSNEKYKYELTHYLENKDSRYPEKKGCIIGTIRLKDIYNFLNSENNNIINNNNKK